MRFLASSQVNKIFILFTFIHVSAALRAASIDVRKVNKIAVLLDLETSLDSFDPETLPPLLVEIWVALSLPHCAGPRQLVFYVA